MDKKYQYAQVIVDIPALELNMRTFSYLIPEELKDKVSVGTPVSVPFGKQDPVFGYVVGFTDYVREEIKIKPIFETLDDDPLFDLKYLEFIEWVANYYLCNLTSALSAAIPSGLWSSTKRVVSLNPEIKKEDLEKLNSIESKICETLMKSKTRSFSPTTIAHKTKIPRAKLYSSIRNLKNKNILSINNVIDGTRAKPKLIEYVELLNTEVQNKRQAQILEVLTNQPDKRIESTVLLKLAKTTRLTLKKLEKLGNIKTVNIQAYRTPLDRFSSVEADQNLELTSYQAEALKFILKDLEIVDNPGPILLYGITGSGKTEVYFQAIEKVIQQGKSVIFLVPEITLTSQISARMIARFGPNIVGIWHSSLSAGERLDVWKKIHSGEIKIVLGARSAVFAPVQNLGLIILDEEHESAYKQDVPSPRYNARDVAIERARRYNAKVLLGSATPDICSYYRARNQNKVLNLPYRIEERPLASITIVDMKEELANGNKTIFSRQLNYEIQDRLNKRHQIILLINRRGYNTYVFCRACGFVSKCKNCSIPLVYHSTTGQLQCHYCNYKQENYEICPDCSSAYIKHYGLGTQRVEEEIKRKFVQARVLRLDSDVTTKKDAHYQIIEDFSEGKADILIGTQMVAKGLDLPGVTLVGVLATDSAFTFPDYRSMERGFQLLTQVAGRAGRGNEPGKVIFQCYSPQIFPIACAQKQDYLSFYSFEIFEREKYNYPPFSQLIRIILSSEDYVQTFSEAMKLYKFLSECFTEVAEKIEILGPSDCIISKLQNKFRMQILLKNTISTHGYKLITQALRQYESKDVQVITDIDPLNML